MRRKTLVRGLARAFIEKAKTQPLVPEKMGRGAVCCVDIKGCGSPGWRDCVQVYVESGGLSEDGI